MVYSVDEIIQRISPVARKHGIQHVYLFGSYARGDATDKSDIDLLVDESGVAAHSLFQWAGIYADFAEALNKEIDMVTLQTLEQPTQSELSVLFRQEVRREMQLIYGRR